MLCSLPQYDVIFSCVNMSREEHEYSRNRMLKADSAAQDTRCTSEARSSKKMRCAYEKERKVQSKLESMCATLKYGSTSQLGMGQVQNGHLYIRYMSSSRRIEETKNEKFDFVHLVFFFLFFFIKHTSKTMWCVNHYAYKVIALLMDIISTCFEL